MNKYEYKILAETDTSTFTIKDVNALGQEGWRVVTWTISDSGKETILFEKKSLEK